MGKHSLKVLMYKNYAGKVVDKDVISEVLKACLPKVKFSEKTWKTYVNRMTNILLHMGYFVRAGSKFVVQDTGAPVSDKARLIREGVVFPATASPASVCDLLVNIGKNDSIEFAMSNGYRNSLAVLKRFKLVTVNGGKIIINSQSVNKYGGYNEAVWSSAKSEPLVVKCIEKMNQDSGITGSELGKFVAAQYNMRWTPASMKRNGNSLRQWSGWVKEGMVTSPIPLPPGRTK